MATTPLDLTNINGMRNPDIKKLRDNGVMNITYLASSTLHELTAIGFGEERAQRFILEAGQILDEMMGGQDGFIMGEELIKNYEQKEVLKTGIPSFDKILGGGFETQKVYEVYGMEKSGKSRLVHQLLVLACLPKSKGGLGSPSAVFIDTEGTFNIEFLRTLAQYYKLDPDTIVKNVAFAQPPTSGNLAYLCWKNLPKIIEKTGARIVVLDSIATHFRAEYGAARNLLPERQMRANQVIHHLKKAAVNYNILVVMTNQAVGNVSGYGAKYKHAMGLVVGHESQIRIRIQKRSGEIRELKIEKAINLPEEKCDLVMTQFGLCEKTDKKKKKSRKKSSKKKSRKKRKKKDDEETDAQEEDEEDEDDTDEKDEEGDTEDEKAEDNASKKKTKKPKKASKSKKTSKAKKTAKKKSS